MPGTTSLGIRYPFQDEVVDNTSWQNMADDIDGLLTQLQTLQTAALHPQTASVSSSGSTNPGAGASVQQVFATEDWDIGGLANLGVSNNLLTLGTGIWYARYSSFLSGYTTVTVVHWGIRVNGTVIAEQEMEATTTSSVGGTVTSLVQVTSAGATLQGNFFWNGTGVGALGTATLQCYKIRDLANV